MQQAIVGFHLDEEHHWVAELSCGHTQHVRHTPPWQNRPWVQTEQGRQENFLQILMLIYQFFRKIKKPVQLYFSTQ